MNLKVGPKIVGKVWSRGIREPIIARGLEEESELNRDFKAKIYIEKPK